MSVAITIDALGLRADHGRGPALLADVALHLPAGGALALVGASGSGKTLVTRALLGLLPPALRLDPATRITADGVALHGFDPAAYAQWRARTAGVMPADVSTALDPLRTLAAQARLTASIAPACAVDVAATFDRVGLDPQQLLARAPHALSGGQRQRAALALALLRAPGLLVVDEPTTALDALGREELVTLLRSLRAAPAPTLLLVTHDLDVAHAIADTVVLLDGGRVVDRGTPPACWSGFTAPAARALVDAWPVLPNAAGIVAQAASDPPDAAHRAPPTPGAPPAPPTALRAHALTVRYRTGAPALHPTDLHIAPGERVAVVGRSGSGKSSLARALAGLEPAASGSVHWLDRPSDPHDLQARRLVQWLPQDAGASLDPRLSIARSITESRRAHGLPCDAGDIAARLSDVGLDPALAPRLPGTLSTGQRQRAALARTLAVEPRVLLLDEPLSGLDPLRAAQVCDLLVTLAAQHRLTLVTILHDLARVPALADRVLLMHEGRVVEDAPTTQLLAAPIHPATAALVDAARRSAGLSAPSGA